MPKPTKGHASNPITVPQLLSHDQSVGKKREVSQNEPVGETDWGSFVISLQSPEMIHWACWRCSVFIDIRGRGLVRMGDISHSSSQAVCGPKFPLVHCGPCPHSMPMRQWLRYAGDLCVCFGGCDDYYCVLVCWWLW